MLNNRQSYRQHSATGKSRQRGLSLLEMLIALALSGTLMAGVVGVFMGMFQTDRSQEGASRIQEAGRFAMNFMGQDIRMAGYQGCSSTLNKANYNNTMTANPASFQPDRNVQGWEANGTDPGDTNNAVNNEAVVDTGDGGWGTTGGNVLDDTNALPGTDIIRVWGADPTVDTVINSVASVPLFYKTINVESDSDISDGDILLLSDCGRGEWVQVCEVSAGAAPATMDLTINNSCSPGNSLNPNILSGAGSKVYKVGGTIYYIGKRNNNGNNPPALFRRQLGATGVAGLPEELVEGVEDMQILYGENTNNDNNNSADRYIPADQVTNWNNVVSVRISLLVQSIENNMVPDPVPYTFNGVVYDGGVGNGGLPPDGRIRRVFTTTINLRNVTLGG